MTYSRLYPQTITADGTDVQTGFINDDSELKRIYGLLDSVGAISLASTKRQSVLYASTLNGDTNFLSASGFNVSLDGSATNVLLAFAYGFDDKGAVDYLNKINTLITNAWTLPSNSTVYLYIDRDISTKLISYGYSALEDLYQKTTPTAVLDQHWYDTNECKMKRYNGSTWEVKQRVFVAKAVTTADATILTIYPLQSRAPQGLNISGNATTADKVNHSLTVQGGTFDGSAAVTIATATQAEAETGTDDTKFMTPLKTAQHLSANIKGKLNASGDAPVYACRAWVNFNGTGTIAIRASGNVSSITDNGTGNYTVNFTTALADANFSSVATCSSTDGSQAFNIAIASQSVNSVKFYTTRVSDLSREQIDASTVSVAIFR